MIDERRFIMLKILAQESAFTALNGPINILSKMARPEDELTLKIKLLASVAVGLHSIIASLLSNKTHDALQGLTEGSEEADEKGIKLIQELSPELRLFAALYCFFEDIREKGDGASTDKAFAMLKTLGHEIPEDLIVGVKE